MYAMNLFRYFSNPESTFDPLCTVSEGEKETKKTKTRKEDIKKTKERDSIISVDHSCLEMVELGEVFCIMETG